MNVHLVQIKPPPSLDLQCQPAVQVLQVTWSKAGQMLHVTWSKPSAAGNAELLVTWSKHPRYLQLLTTIEDCKWVQIYKQHNFKQHPTWSCCLCHLKHKIKLWTWYTLELLHGGKIPKCNLVCWKAFSRGTCSIWTSAWVYCWSEVVCFGASFPLAG